MQQPQNRGAHPIVLLQGPVGEFFSALGAGLVEAGYPVVKFQFNAADTVFQRGPYRTEYVRGDLSAWEAMLLDFCIAERPRAILMFGDRRPVHSVACRVAEQLGIRVFSFEEGYVRPAYVTFEEGGNNARSSIARGDILAAPCTEPPRPRAIPASVFGISHRATAYFIVARLGKMFFPTYRHHRRRGLRKEAVLWARNILRKFRHSREDLARTEELRSKFSKKYFLVGLQVHDDLQLRHHGDGWTQERMIVATLLSFARAAPAEMQLVMRYHPMDRGHRSYERLVRALALALGISDRVTLMYNGEATTLLNHAAGFVTINSTMSLSAMYHGCPVYIFGKAFYRMEGLTAPGEGAEGLDAFWNSPAPVDAGFFTCFRYYLIRNTQLNGSFYAPRYHAAMSAQVIARLRAAGIAPEVRAAS